jgi:hypothetical protein
LISLWKPTASPDKGGDGENWRELLLWAGRLYEQDSFDAVERNYKLAAADKVREARVELVADGDWLPLLREALGGQNNLVDWRARDDFLNWCKAQPEAASSAIRSLWSGADDSEVAIDSFADGVTYESTAGNKVNIASVLLMGIDPEQNPPFRAAVDQKARKLLGITDRAKALELKEGRTYRPDALAEMLGVAGRSVRGFLRKTFPRSEEERNTAWQLDVKTARAVVEHFNPSAANTTPGSRYATFVELVDEFVERLRATGTELRDRLDAQSLLWWVTSGDAPEAWSDGDRSAFHAYQRGETALHLIPGALPNMTESLARELYLPRPWLQQAIDLLNEKRQAIFYGPPGTGKTFVAQAIGEHVRAAGGDWRLVQFHPAYTYEDFFEGYRPSKSEDDAALHFDLRRGPLRLIAEAAAADPANPYLLVIDEINRGNIAKIFGELYFLLEYRDRPIRLQYSPEQEFKLPENLYVLGTMNTADRSIALIDSALRRRFYFFPFLPREWPVRDVLSAWLKEKGFNEESARLLEALNGALQEALPNDEFAFGPSYFMPAQGPPDLDGIWRYAIHPLLEERFYGVRRSDDLDHEFGLDAMRARVSDAAQEAAAQDGEERTSSN